MYTVQFSLLSVLLLQICNAFPYASDIIINFYGGPNQIKINSKKEAPRDYLSFENSFYKYHRGPQSWSKARQICEAEGGHLAIINSVDEANFLLGLMKKYPNEVLNDVVHKDFVLIGFHDCFKEGEYVTIDGKSIEASGYMHWAPSQPDNAGGNENCGSLWRNGGLNDFSCTTTSPFICEIPSDFLCTVETDNNDPINKNQSTVIPRFDVRTNVKDE